MRERHAGTTQRRESLSGIVQRLAKHLRCRLRVTETRRRKILRRDRRTIEHGAQAVALILHVLERQQQVRGTLDQFIIDAHLLGQAA